MGVKWFILGLALTLMCFSGLLANPSRRVKINKGKAEHVACGIDVYDYKISQVVAMYGNPTRLETYTSQKPKEIYSNKSYFWDLPDLKMEVSVMFFPNKTSSGFMEDGVYCVTLQRIKSQEKIGVTGAGLKLGDSLSEVTKIYGKQFLIKNVSGTKEKYLSILWEDGTILLARFDENNRIKRLSLLAKKEWNIKQN